MEYQETPFIRFMLHTWIEYQKFRGASKICALLLNFFLLLFKLVFCGVALLILVPHLAAIHLISKKPRTPFTIILYVVCVVISLIADIPLVLLTLIGVYGCVSTLPYALTSPGMFVIAVLSGVLTFFLGKLSWKLISSIFLSRETITEEDNVEEEEEVEEVEQDKEDVEDYDDTEDITFCQLFKLGTEMCLLIDHIEMCPDETALIRVVHDEGYTPLYKRRVKRDKEGNRFITFNGTDYYLDDKKTQPIISKK